MSLWVDKHRPRTLSSLDYHKEQAEELKKLVNSGDFPHLLVYGPSGAGKKTRIMCLLRELYGNGVEKLRIEREEFETPSKKRIEITTIASNYHIEINPSDCGIYDRIVVQEIIKTIAQSNQLDSNIQKDFKIIVLTEVDKLTKDAQHALRRTMEKYMSTCRLILCCNTSSKVLGAVRSRCLCIRVPAPTEDQIVTVLKQTCKLENTNIPEDILKKIVSKTNRNMRKALLVCETLQVSQQSHNVEQYVLESDWEIYLRETARLIIQQQNVEKVVQIRERLYELLCHCIPTDVIFKGLLKELLSMCDTQIKADIVQIAADLEHKMNLGEKQIFYLESFVIKFMFLYKKFMDKSVADCL